MTPSGRQIKETMEIAELMKPLNTRVGRRVRNDKIIKVTKTQGGRVGMCAEAKSRGNCDHRPKGLACEEGRSALWRASYDQRTSTRSIKQQRNELCKWA